MPRPNSGSTKFTISGKRAAETIVVDVQSGDLIGYTIDGVFKALSLAQIEAGVIVKAAGGNDIVAGGRGDDEIDGGDGADVLNGGGGLDKLLGGAGDDILSDDLTGAIFDGGRGRDTLDFSQSATGIGVYEDRVEAGIDLEFSTTYPLIVHHYSPAIEGRIANIEVIIGSDHEDVILGGVRDDEIHGGLSTDLLGGGGATGGDVDQLFGGGGDDVLLASAGVDWLTGGSGADQFHFSANQYKPGTDIILDYNKAEGDSLVFGYAQAGPTWTPYSYASANDSLIGTYGNGGGSVILVGVTSTAQIEILVLGGQTIIDGYHYDPGF